MPSRARPTCSSFILIKGKAMLHMHGHYYPTRALGLETLVVIRLPVWIRSRVASDHLPEAHPSGYIWQVA